MNQSENINELACALSKAQGEMQAAIKDSINPFFKSKYADLGSVWDAARPVLSKNGLCVMQTTEMVSDKIVMVTTLAHNSGQWMKSQLPLNPSKNDSQGIGAAITYLRRYSLSALVGVVCDNDDDGETAVGRGKIKECAPTPFVPKEEDGFSNHQVGIVLGMVEQLDAEGKKGFFKWIKEFYGADSLNNVPSLAFQKCTTVLNAKIKLGQDKKEAVA